jgi:hypothetical protein
MRTALALPLIAPLALAACTSGPATPTVVQLDRDLLSVRMSDGATCRGPAPDGDRDAGWSGVLQDCPWDYGYTVAMDPQTNPLRLVLEEVLGAIGADGVLVPLATVTITGADGSARVFETPDRVPR